MAAPIRKAISSRFPEAILLRREDDTGYGFFFVNDEDFRHAAESFTQPILRSFRGPALPNQPEPHDHLRTAIATLLGQAFDRTNDADIGSEGISRAAAAAVRQSFGAAPPNVVVIERVKGRINVRAGTEFLDHPGYPIAVVVDGDTHGGEARFFASQEAFQKAGESAADAHMWLPQIVFRLYALTPSVMAGRPLSDAKTGKASVACRALTFGQPAALLEREEG